MEKIAFDAHMSGTHHVWMLKVNVQKNFLLRSIVIIKIERV